MTYPCLCQLRPGGLGLTERLLARCGLGGSSRVLDLGCGRGETAVLIRRRYTDHVCAIDPDPALLAAARAADPQLKTCCLAAEALRCRNERFDLVVAECSLSLARTGRALAEISRVLKPGGRLAFSDLYARGEEAEVSEEGRLLRRIYSREHWLSLLSGAGLVYEGWEDASACLHQMMGQLILDHGMEEAHCLLGLDSCALRRARPGYLLLWAVKP